MKLTNLLMLTLIGISTCDSKKIKCPLKWEETSGVSEISSAIPTASHQQGDLRNFIVRSKNSQGDFSIGNYPVSSQNALIPDLNNWTAFSPSTFEVLTNPHDCELNWEPSPSEFSFKEGNDFIIRAAKEYSLVAGYVRGESAIIVTQSLNVEEMNVDFQFLSSYLPSLRMTPGNLTLDDNGKEPVFEFIGVEEIHNRSPATVKQTVEHYSRTMESMTIKTSSSWYSGTSFQIGATFDFNFVIPVVKIPVDLTVGVSFGFSNEIASSVSNTKSVSTTKEVSVKRELVVAPMSSVMACSMVIKLKDYQAKYSSIDTYSAPGLSGSEVNALLREDGITHGIINGDIVEVSNTGEIQANIFLTSRFFVSEIGSGKRNICSLND